MTYFKRFVSGAAIGVFLVLSVYSESSAQAPQQRTPTPNDTLISPEVHVRQSGVIPHLCSEGIRSHAAR